jgi:hypothetical protein
VKLLALMVLYISTTVAHNRTLFRWFRTGRTPSNLISESLIEHASQGTEQNFTGCVRCINSYGLTYSRLIYSTRCKSGTSDTFSLCCTGVHTRLESLPRFLRTCDFHFDCIEVVRRLTFSSNILHSNYEVEWEAHNCTVCLRVSAGRFEIIGLGSSRWTRRWASFSALLWIFFCREGVGWDWKNQEKETKRLFFYGSIATSGPAPHYWGLTTALCGTAVDEWLAQRWELYLTTLNSMALVRERTIPTERPPPVGEVSANFCG